MALRPTARDIGEDREDGEFVIVVPKEQGIAPKENEKEKEDENIIHTALREAEEETGIDTSGIVVTGTLTPLFIPVSRMVVTAVTSWTESKPVFRPDPREVVFLIEADLTKFTDPSIVKVRPMELRGEIYDIRYFSYEGHVIWGATAMMLNELLEIIKRENISLEIG
jgi:8-oxo-dGTP pyrophosphatase MutT (NUDIX family)